MEKGSEKLVNGRPLKATSHYWRSRIAGYQLKLNKSGSKTSRMLELMLSALRRRVKDYIDFKARHTVE